MGLFAWIRKLQRRSEVAALDVMGTHDRPSNTQTPARAEPVQAGAFEGTATPSLTAGPFGCEISGADMPKSETSSLGSHLLGDAGDIGEAGIIDFGREVFPDPVAVASAINFSDEDNSDTTATLDLSGLEIPKPETSAMRRAEWFEQDANEAETIVILPPIERQEQDAPAASVIGETSIESAVPKMDLPADDSEQTEPGAVFEAIVPDVEWAPKETPAATLPTNNVEIDAFLADVQDAPVEPVAEVTTAAVVESTPAAEIAPTMEVAITPVMEVATTPAMEVATTPVMEAAIVADAPPAITFEAPAAVEEAPVPVFHTVAAVDEPAIATATFAAPAPEAPAVLEEASAPAVEVKKSRDPLIESLILTLMEEAKKRADSAVTAYEALADKVGDYANRSNRTARTAWSIVGAMSVGIFVGGIWGSYKLARATSVAESLQEQVAASSVAVLERDQLRNQLSLSHAAEFQSALELRAARQAASHAEVELQSYQRRIETGSENRAHQTGYAPSTQPTQTRADTGPVSMAPEAEISPMTQAIPAPTARPSDSWATLLGQ